MSKLSVQSTNDGSTEEPTPDAGLLHKEKLVIPKVKREALSDQNSATNRMSTPGSARKRAAAAKHSKAAANPPAVELCPQELPQSQLADDESTKGGWTGWTQTFEQPTYQGALTFESEPQSCALSTLPTLVQDAAGHEQYDMCYRSPMALHGMLEVILLACTCVHTDSHTLIIFQQHLVNIIPLMVAPQKLNTD